MHGYFFYSKLLRWHILKRVQTFRSLKSPEVASPSLGKPPFKDTPRRVMKNLLQYLDAS